MRSTSVHRSACLKTCLVFLLATIAGWFLAGADAASAGNLPALKIGVPLNYPAFSFQEDPEDEVQGYSVDVLNIMGRNMGAAPRFLVGRAEDLFYALAQGELDLVCGLARGSDVGSQFNYLEISIYVKRYTYRYLPALKPKTQLPDRTKTVVVVGGTEYGVDRLLIPAANLIEARTVKEALFLVNAGAAQEYVGYSDRLATYLIGKHDLQNVRQAGVAMSRFPLSMVTHHKRPDLAAQLRQALGKAIQSGDLERVRDKWLSDNYLSFLWESYGIWAIIGIGFLLTMVVGVATWNRTLKSKVNDVTQKLQLSEQRYRQLIESSPDFVFLLTGRGDLRMANQSVSERLGIPAARLTGMRIYDLVAVDDREKCREFLKTLFTERMASVELRMERGPEQPMDVEIVATILHRRKDSERLACCFARDLTMRKLMEKELIKSERLSTIGKMAAGVAHEVNNPLGIISAHTEELLSEELNAAEKTESLDIIRRNAVRAGRIIETLLGQASSRPPQMATLDLAEIIAGCINFLRPRLKKINIEAELVPGRYWIKGDENQLQQVFVNLLLNATESLSGEGLIQVRVQNGRGGDAHHHHIRIEDSGRGIDPLDRDRVFDPFYTKNKQKGVGLGLFVSERIISKHEGTISVADSRLGGAAMIVSLPAHIGAEL